MKSDYRSKRVTTSNEENEENVFFLCWINNTFHVDASVFSTFQLMNTFSQEVIQSAEKKSLKEGEFAMIQCGFSNENTNDSFTGIAEK